MGASQSGLATVLGAFFAFFIIFLIIAVIFAIIGTVIKCILINKAEPGSWWKGIIPIYNRWTIYDMSFNRKTTILVFALDLVLTFASTGINIITRTVNNVQQYSISNYNSGVHTVSGTLLAISGLASMIGMVIALVYAVVKGYANYALCYAFGRETWFCVLAIFFPFIMKAIMAFSPSIEYEEDKLELIKD